MFSQVRTDTHTHSDRLQLHWQQDTTEGCFTPQTTRTHSTPTARRVSLGVLPSRCGFLRPCLCPWPPPRVPGVLLEDVSRPRRRAALAPAAGAVHGDLGHGRKSLEVLGRGGGFGDGAPWPLGQVRASWATPAAPAPGAVVVPVVAQAAGSHHGFHGSLLAKAQQLLEGYRYAIFSPEPAVYRAFICHGIPKPQWQQPTLGGHKVRRRAGDILGLNGAFSCYLQFPPGVKFLQFLLRAIHVSKFSGLPSDPGVLQSLVDGQSLLGVQDDQFSNLQPISGTQKSVICQWPCTCHPV